MGAGLREARGNREEERTVIRLRSSIRLALLVGILGSTVALTGCILFAVPKIVSAMKGSKTSTATVVIDEEPRTVYVQAVAIIKERGYTRITKQDDAKFFVEGTRDGKNATFQATGIGANQTQVILTIENDEGEQALNNALQGVMDLCRRLDVECQQGEG